jgi:hypothetical protein
MKQKQKYHTVKLLMRNQSVEFILQKISFQNGIKIFLKNYAQVIICKGLRTY